MKRRFFLQSLGAFGLNPIAPKFALGLPNPDPTISASLYQKAAEWAGLWDHSTAPMLKYAFNIDDKTANAIFDRLVSEGRVGIPDGTGMARSLVSTYKNPYAIDNARKMTRSEYDRMDKSLANKENSGKVDKDKAQPQRSAMKQEKFQPRPFEDQEIEPLAQLWFEGWHQAHADYVPKALTQLRTKEDFSRRLREHPRQDSVTLGPIGDPLALCLIRGDELYQVYVAKSAQGTGIAQQLMTAAENLLRSNGVKNAHLDVIEENGRAQAFYTKMGWKPDQIELAKLDTSDGIFELPCRIFRKDLTD